MPPIKISVPDWCYYSKLGPADAYYETLVQLGVGAVEMVDPSRFPQARAAGLEILNQSGPGMERGLNRIEHHAELLPQLRASIRSASEHQIPLVIIFSGNRAGQPDSVGIENCRRGIEALLPDAEQNGVTLGFEMLCTHNHPDYQACRGDFGFALCREIRSPMLKIVYDIYHLQREGDDAASDVPAHLDCIAHLHLAESPDRSAPRADGQIPYQNIVPPIVNAGYAGYWGLEYLPGANPLAELSDSIAMLRALSR